MNITFNKNSLKLYYVQSSFKNINDPFFQKKEIAFFHIFSQHFICTYFDLGSFEASFTVPVEVGRMGPTCTCRMSQTIGMHNET